jgi:hypothetical protein
MVLVLMVLLKMQRLMRLKMQRLMRLLYLLNCKQTWKQAMELQVAHRELQMLVAHNAVMVVLALFHCEHFWAESKHVNRADKLPQQLVVVSVGNK